MENLMSRLILLAAAAVLASAACTTPAPDTGSPAAVANEPATAATAPCNAERVRWAIGQKASADVVTRAQSESGSASVRVLGPNTPMTKDLRTDRLNLMTDAQEVVTDVNCG